MDNDKYFFLAASGVVLTIVFLGNAAMMRTDLSYGKISSAPKKCDTIQNGNLYSGTDLIKPGYNQWGYNYQARMFNGYYCDAYKDAAWCQPYKEDKLSMQWNDAWLSNQDCDGDALLDRHYGYIGYKGSGAWLTNHQSGTYEEDGNSCPWNYFVKIAAAPSDAVQSGGIWYNADGTEIGEAIWGEFAVIQSIYNDSCAGTHGPEYISPVGPGFGKF